MKYRASTNDMTREVVNSSDNASLRFQSLVDRCLDDGTVTRSEAIMLVQQHNSMQEVSREALKQLLAENMQYPPSNLIRHHQLTPITDLEVRGDSGVQGVPERSVPHTTFTVKGASRGRGYKNWTPGVQKLDLVHNKDTLKDIVVSAFADQRVRFAMITVPAAFFSTLRFIGVL